MGSISKSTMGSIRKSTMGLSLELRRKGCLSLVWPKEGCLRVGYPGSAGNKVPWFGW